MWEWTQCSRVWNALWIQDRNKRQNSWIYYLIDRIQFVCIIEWVKSFVWFKRFSIGFVWVKWINSRNLHQKCQLLKLNFPQLRSWICYFFHLNLPENLHMKRTQCSVSITWTFVSAFQIILYGWWVVLRCKCEINLLS